MLFLTPSVSPLSPDIEGYASDMTENNAMERENMHSHCVQSRILGICSQVHKKGLSISLKFVKTVFHEVSHRMGHLYVLPRLQPDINVFA